MLSCLPLSESKTHVKGVNFLSIAVTLYVFLCPYLVITTAPSNSLSIVDLFNPFAYLQFNIERQFSTDINFVMLSMTRYRPL
jgi:hypothetical protein